MKMRDKMLVVLLLAAVVMVWVLLPLGRDVIQRAQDTLDWQAVGGPARSPWWYVTHCDYIEIDPMDESPDLPDGIYENCDESSTKSPSALEQFESVWGAAIEATKPTVIVPLPTPKPAPDTWEHWFPTVPKPDKKKKDLSDRYNDKTLDPTRTMPGEPARHWEPATPWGLLKGTTIY